MMKNNTIRILKQGKILIGIATDEGTMISWFCAAIMAGYDNGGSKIPEKTEEKFFCQNCKEEVKFGNHFCKNCGRAQLWALFG